MVQFFFKRWSKSFEIAHQCSNFFSILNANISQFVQSNFMKLLSYNLRQVNYKNLWFNSIKIFYSFSYVNATETAVLKGF